MNRKKSYLLLILIVCSAFFFRIWNINLIPPSLNWDEVSLGYNAYSILKTGKDEWGIKFPLMFRVYGDYKLPLYIYLTSISEFFLGLNALSVRLVSILSGVGLVIFSFLITKKITKSVEYSLIASLLTALSPWSLFLSRVALEANLGAFLFAGGVFFIVCWFKDDKRKNLIWAMICWGLSIHAYNSARIIIPLMFIFLIFISFKKKTLRSLFIPVLILIIFSLPLIFQIFNRSAGARFNLVSLVDQGTINQIIEKRNDLKLPNPVPRIIFNKATFFLYFSVKNYLSNLSFRYLFLRGGSHYQFSIPDHELLFLVTVPFLIIGILKTLVKKTDAEKFLGFWFFISFIPSAVTRDAPHVLRTIFVLPCPMIFTAIGIKFVSDFLMSHKSFFKGNLLLTIFLLSVFVSFGKWWADYINIYPKAYSWAWQYGYKEAVSFIKQNYDKYDKILVTKRYGEPHEFILFNYPWNPSIYQTDPGKIWDYHADWYWIDGFDKFVFINDWEVIEKVSAMQRLKDSKKRYLLVTSPGNYPEGWNKIKTIEFLDGKSVFEILEKEN